MIYSAIILAAGTGKRMNLGFNKMFLSINDKPLLTLSASHFFNDMNCQEIIYVANVNEMEDIKKALIDHSLFDERCQIISGGSERQYSVYNGLCHITNEVVLVHDAARPFISQSLINELIAESLMTGCSIPAVKVKDTIKLVTDNMCVNKTLPRHLLYAVQTPQACLTSVLKTAHQKAKEDQFLGTDEASLIEEYQLTPVKIIESNYDNIKLTTIEDIQYAMHLYPKYFKGGV